MLLEIRHRLRYDFSREVFLEPHLFRLKPRTDHAQTLESHSMRVLPTPAGQAEVLGPFNEPALEAWFQDKIPNLEIECVSRVRTRLENPFQYLVSDPKALKLPVRYEPKARKAVAPYLAGRPDPAVGKLAARFRREAKGATLDFLRIAADTLPKEIRQILRPEGEPWKPARTLRAGEGACRDLTVVFLELCRSVGLAARFTSGYKLDPEAPDSHELHAWAEVFLPGAGWRAYDPSLGLAAGDEHVALASAPTAEGAAPVEGHFRGTGVTSKMEYNVDVVRLE